VIRDRALYKKAFSAGFVSALPLSCAQRQTGKKDCWFDRMVSKDVHIAVHKPNNAILLNTPTSMTP
jgi:hypothetical protein